MTSPNRPKTCGALAKIDPTLGAEGCKRLPRHGGDHRGFLTAREAAKAVAKPKASKSQPKAVKALLNDIVRDIRTQVGQARGRLNAAKRREALGLLSGAVDAGRLSASDALGLVARF